eukprot:483834-Pleurochrysis_carterae.AAC.1
MKYRELRAQLSAQLAYEPQANFEANFACAPSGWKMEHLLCVVTGCLSAAAAQIHQAGLSPSGVQN